MSITTYAELQAAVGSWLHRSDLTANIPDFIQLGEARLNRALRLFSMENVTALTASTSNRFLTLPTGFIEAIDLALYDNNYPQVLTQISLSSINERATDISALPHYYAVSTNIIFDVIPAEAYSCELRYYKKLDIATDLTNSVLTTNPDLYLYSALLAATPFINNDNRIPMWDNTLGNSIKMANHLDARTRNKAKLRTDIYSHPRGDIISGDTW